MTEERKLTTVWIWQTCVSFSFCNKLSCKMKIMTPNHLRNNRNNTTPYSNITNTTSHLLACHSSEAVETLQNDWTIFTLQHSLCRITLCGLHLNCYSIHVHSNLCVCAGKLYSCNLIKHKFISVSVSASKLDLTKGTIFPKHQVIKEDKG